MVRFWARSSTWAGEMLGEQEQGERRCAGRRAAPGAARCWASKTKEGGGALGEVHLGGGAGKRPGEEEAHRWGNGGRINKTIGGTNVLSL